MLKNRVRLCFMILEGGGPTEWSVVNAFAALVALVLTFPSQSAANLCLFYADETQTARSTPLMPKARDSPSG